MYLIGKIKKISLRQLRFYWSLASIILFFTLLYFTDFSRLKGYQVGLFLELDPLVWLSGFLSSFTVYKAMAIALILILPTIFLGRFFCSWICPLGIMNQFFSWLLLKRRAIEDYEVNLYKPIYRLKYYILISLLILSVLGANQIGLFDPIVTVYRAFSISFYPAFNGDLFRIYRESPIYLGGVLIGGLFIILIFANRFITRFWCRALCPLGGLLGLISIKSIYRIRRDIDKCTECNKCLRSCQGASDPHDYHRVTECHLCMNCIDDCPEGALEYRAYDDKRVNTEEKFDISRRRVLETVTMSALLFPVMKGSIGARTLPASSVIRPPGSISEKDFLKRCIKCALCMRVCPTNALHPALLECGIEGIWTPIMVNKIGYCEHHCTLCSVVCPTGAIKEISVKEKVGDDKTKPVKLGTAFFDRGRCLPWAMDTECIVCEEVCPTTPKAIWYEKVEIVTRDKKTKVLKRPLLQPDLCIGCGACENKCPVVDLPAVRVSSVGESRSKENVMILK